MMNMFNSFLVTLLKTYQYCISPVFPPSCRFEPTCSTYFIQAVREHGTVYGAWLGVCRVCRCHPGCSAGYDPVPNSTKILEDK